RPRLRVRRARRRHGGPARHRLPRHGCQRHRRCGRHRHHRRHGQLRGLRRRQPARRRGADIRQLLPARLRARRNVPGHDRRARAPPARPLRTRRMTWRMTRRWPLAVVPAAVVAGPFVLPAFAVTTVTEAMILGLFALSLDLLVGYTGLDSFGHAAAYGLGAYAGSFMLLDLRWPLPIVVLGAAIITALVAVPIGWLCTRTTGVSFAMLTLAFAQLLYAIAYKWNSVTGGSDGLAGVPRTPGPFGLTQLQSK